MYLAFVCYFKWGKSIFVSTFIYVARESARSKIYAKTNNTQVTKITDKQQNNTYDFCANSSQINWYYVAQWPPVAGSDQAENEQFSSVTVPIKYI